MHRRCSEDGAYSGQKQEPLGRQGPGRQHGQAEQDPRRGEKHQPPGEFVADQFEGKAPETEGIHQVPLIPERLEAPGHGADLPAELRTNLAGTRHQAYRLVHRHGPESVLLADQRRREIPAQGAGEQGHVQVPPDGIEAAAGSNDTPQPGLQRANRHLVPHVSRFRPVSLSRDVADAQVPPAGNSDTGILKDPDQWLQRLGENANRGVGVDDHVAGEVGRGGVLGRRLAAPLREPEELDAPVGIFPHDVVGPIGGSIRGYQDLPPIDGIVQREQAVDRPADGARFVIRR